MAAGKDMLHAFQLEADKTTKIHVVNLKTGDITKIDSGLWSMVMHFGNSYQIDDHTIVTYTTGFEDSAVNPFTATDFDIVGDADKTINWDAKGHFRKWTINLETKSVSTESLINY